MKMKLCVRKSAQMLMILFNFCFVLRIKQKYFFYVIFNQSVDSVVDTAVVADFKERLNKSMITLAVSIYFLRD